MASAILTILLLLPLLPLATFAQAEGNITSASGSLTADDRNSSWKSPSGDFAFGFKRIENGDFLLAIWFARIPEETVIWWANGDKLAPQGSEVVLTKEGSFALNDPKGNLIWSPGISAGVSYASMLDTGNFVLANETDSVLWDSFRDPSDTLMPTQVLSKGAKLVSRYSDTNYSTGRFELSMQSDGNLVMYTLPFISNDLTPSYWSSQTVSGYQLVFNPTGKIYLANQSGSVLYEIMTSLVSDNNYQIVVLEYDGVFRQYTYPRNVTLGSQAGTVWSLTSSPVPQNICMKETQAVGKGVCGINSYCTLQDEARPRCNCPDGYSYIDPSYPMDGCKPDFIPQSCDEGMLETDSFEMRRLPSTNWPLNDYESIDNQTEESCRQACLNDCFCHFAIFGRSSACWKKRMPVSNGALVASNSGTTALIKVRTNSTSKIQPCDPEKKDNGPSIIQQKNRPLIIVGLSSLSALNLVLLLLTFLFWFRYNRAQKEVYRLRPYLISKRVSSLRSFTYKELSEATDQFKEELGRGAFGSVYKGVLKPNERSLIAVKVLDKLTADGDGEFNTEVDIIGQTNHRNLVKLIGFCNEGQNRHLVYDFMPNGSLAGFLFKGSRPSWFRRIEIACGVARGLLYLHEECSKQIIHCDIKPQNILLDESLTAKISDFGLAKLLMFGQTRTMTAIRGTKGYLAPEWFRNKPISAKVDVYSFGILLLELICCRKNCEFQLSDEAQMILSDWVYDCYREGRLDLIGEGDEEMLGDMKRMRRFVMIALWCIQEDPSLRPSMKNVSQMLEEVVEVSMPPGPSLSISLVDS